MSQKRAFHVTQHALAQARTRFPDLLPAQHGLACVRIIEEVADAIEAQRMATRIPRWAVRKGLRLRRDVRMYGGKQDGGARRQQNTRIVWNAAQTRLWVVQRRSTGGFKVITGFAPGQKLEEGG